MNGYIGFYSGKTVEVFADTSYKAQQLAVSFFNPPKSKQHMVHIHLAEKDGAQVTHVAVD